MSQIFRYHLIRNISGRCRSFCTTSLVEAEKLDIPVRIKRGPTDILKALAATVQQDVTGPLYKFHDDPFLIPTSNYQKKSYALSKESGRKAARWIRDNYGEYFNHQPDDPVIKEFLPKLIVNENSEVNEEILLQSIKNIQVSEAITVYSICQSKNIEISADTRQALLELLSYYNCDEAPDPEWMETIKSQFVNRNNSVRSWKEKGLAEELFAGLKENGAKPYCAIIKGMCAYSQGNRAWELYQEALDKKLVLDSGTFNALISIAYSLREESNLKWLLIQELLHTMVEQQVPPNLGTMNSILETLSMMRGWLKSSTLSLQVLSEFRRFNIKPSLGTYYLLLKIHYNRKSAVSPLLPSILDAIEGKSFTLQDIKDTWFFFTAMDICQKDLQSWETAERVHNVLLTGDNYKFMGESFKSLLYYRQYMNLAANFLPLEDFMTIYDSLVPNVYSPTVEVYEEIVNAIGTFERLDLLPRIWSDITLVVDNLNERVTETILMVMNNTNNENVEKMDAILASQMVNVAWDIWTRVQTQRENLRQKIEWNGQMLGDCAAVLARYGDLEKSGQILNEVENKPSIVHGILPEETLKQIFDVALKEDNFEICLMTAKYAKNNEYAVAIEMAKSMSQSPQLSKTFKNKLIYLFGTDI